MGYLIDRYRALFGDDIVAIVDVRQHRVRSRVILRDNSLYHTLTRPKTFLRAAARPATADARPAQQRLRIRDAQSKEAVWRTPRGHTGRG
ncbi:MAG: hypothetical protein HY352_06815 [Candidatus Omnitrophica bacterium]|nr:hypothetical protein [Candidatus Omnitrophota bacterium]